MWLAGSGDRLRNVSLTGERAALGTQDPLSRILTFDSKQQVNSISFGVISFYRYVIADGSCIYGRTPFDSWMQVRAADNVQIFGVWTYVSAPERMDTLVSTEIGRAHV